MNTDHSTSPRPVRPSEGANEPQPGAIPPSGETTPAPTDITPALDFYNRECARLTLPEYIARRIKAFNPVEAMLLTEWQLAKLIALAIAEYEEVNSIASVTLTPTGTGYTVLPVVTAATGNEGDEYRMLEAGEIIQYKDEYDRCGTWDPVVSNAVGVPLFRDNVGHYRRKITPNKAQPETPTPTTTEVIEKLTV